MRLMLFLEVYKKFASVTAKNSVYKWKRKKTNTPQPKDKKEKKKATQETDEMILEWKNCIQRAINHTDTPAELHCRSTYHFWLIIFENSYRTFCCNLGHDDDGKKYPVKKVKIYSGSLDNTSGLLALAGAGEHAGGRSSTFSNSVRSSFVPLWTFSFLCRFLLSPSNLRPSSGNTSSSVLSISF